MPFIIDKFKKEFIKWYNCSKFQDVKGFFQI